MIERETELQNPIPKPIIIVPKIRRWRRKAPYLLPRDTPMFKPKAA